jgi:DnaJ-class molecular chaperone
MHPVCPECLGVGTVFDEQCPDCHGTGVCPDCPDPEDP